MLINLKVIFISHLKHSNSNCMKKSLVLLAAGAIMLTIGCTKSAKQEVNLPIEDDNGMAVNGRHCASHEVLEEQLKNDPSLAQRMNQIEEFTRQALANPQQYRVLTDGTLELPVWVNVLYKTSAENISDAQIQSQIDVLNEDYGYTNADRTNIPSLFSGVVSNDIKIRFIWDPSRVTRKATTKTSWRTDDAMKKSNRGGIDPTSPTTTLNIWVCNLSSGLLGYAQFPGGNSSTDGVVCDNNAFGRGNYSLYTAFNKGRTATHEVGHWFNLRHIWGDATCGSDQVNDTPPHRTANYGCPGVINITCTNNTTTNPFGFTREMTMNYMDYTDDACMYMFTNLQASRMKLTFAVGGPRAGLRL